VLTTPVISAWMDKLKGYLDDYSIPPELIYNMDETMLEVGNGRAKVITTKNAPRPHIPTPSKGEHITLALCVTAAGSVVRPLCILPLKQLPRLDPKTEQFFFISGQNNGSITKEIFEGWSIAALIPHVQQTRQTIGRPRAWALLLVDGHNSRDHIPTIITLDKYWVLILVLPAHSSTVCQPLDLTCNHELKRILTNYFKPKKGEPREETRIRLLNTAVKCLQVALSGIYIQAGFARAGIWPFSRDAPLKSSLVRDPQDEIVKEAPTKKPQRIGISGKLLNARIDMVATSSIITPTLSPNPTLLLLPPATAPNPFNKPAITYPIQFVVKK
jgi:hypothetical protein